MKLHQRLFNINFSESIQEGINEFAHQSGYVIKSRKEKLPATHKLSKFTAGKIYLFLLLITVIISAFAAS